MRKSRKKAAKRNPERLVSDTPRAAKETVEHNEGSAPVPEFIPTKQANERKHFKPNDTPWWKAVLELLTFCVGLCAVWVYRGQWEASLVANQLIAANFEAGQRAWVLISDLSNSEDFSATKRVPINFVLKNFGLSPALKVHLDLAIDAGGGACIGHPFVSPYKSEMTLAPGSPGKLPNFWVGPLPQSCLDDLRSGVAHYGFSGVIRYEDIFKKPHHTPFCTQYEGMSSNQLTACPTTDNPD